MDLSACIAYLRPDAEWKMDGEDIDTLEFFSNHTAPTFAECEAAWPDAKAKIDELAAAREKARAAVLEKIGITDDELKLLVL